MHIVILWVEKIGYLGVYSIVLDFASLNGEVMFFTHFRPFYALLGSKK